MRSESWKRRRRPGERGRREGGGPVAGRREGGGGVGGGVAGVQTHKGSSKTNSVKRDCSNESTGTRLVPI